LRLNSSTWSQPRARSGGRVTPRLRKSLEHTCNRVGSPIVPWNVAWLDQLRHAAVPGSLTLNAGSCLSSSAKSSASVISTTSSFSSSSSSYTAGTYPTESSLTLSSCRKSEKSPRANEAILDAKDAVVATVEAAEWIDRASSSLRLLLLSASTTDTVGLKETIRPRSQVFLLANVSRFANLSTHRMAHTYVCLSHSCCRKLKTQYHRALSS
jgi:hypothetical protein